MNVLAISAHPDDETLGCGGSLLKHRAAGDEVSWVIASVCHAPQWPVDLIQRKSAEVDRVAGAYGMKNVWRLGFPNARLDTVATADLMASLGEAVKKSAPEIVYLLHGGDIHTDHHALFTAAMSIFKPFYMARLNVRRVLCYETLSSSEAAPPRWDRAFVPNVFSDITPYIDRKVEIMELYESEIHADPMPRGPSAIRALARYRGATISVNYAEAFTLVREILS
jgi:LmbE family N-acetylglucosaminyl deacetylase